MTNRIRLQKELDTYLRMFPDEVSGLRLFSRFIEQFDGRALYDRKNFTGHITASGMIYEPHKGELLLLEHVQLKKWLQPGGHVEPSDTTILEAALREVREETGITADKLSLRATADGFSIVDIDSHYIPPCEYKGEAEHYHHDIRFLFTLSDCDAPIELDTAESHSYRWMRVKDIPDNYGFSRLEAKLPLFL